jgi:hypothetical protein
MIACLFTSSGEANHTTDAIMSNFSEDGVFMESSHDFRIGALLHLRMVDYPITHQSVRHKKQPRSNCLAEVKWRRENVAFGVRQLAIGKRTQERVARRRHIV